MNVKENDLKEINKFIIYFVLILTIIKQDD